jgi:two-component system chemotaxis response regulator CheB
VVVIDDSAFNRQTISAMLESSGEIEVVGRAGDGQEGLNLVFQLAPDVITLDLEMPKLDGFGFLRILMSRKPTPVIVISGYATKDNVFKSLELGALDFVAKPARQISPALKAIQDELLTKVKMVTQLKMISLTERAARGRTTTGSFPVLTPGGPEKSRKEGLPPARLCAIGASTGGPPAIHQLLGALDPQLPLGLVITQHMPAKFTKAFAERLARTTPWTVREAEPGDALTAGVVLVAPGSHSLVLKREGGQGMIRADLVPQDPNDRFVPSVDRMMESVAKVGGEMLAVILTGMGGDGGRGVLAVKAAGGYVIAEAPETAVIFGMPDEAIRSGAVDEIVPLGSIAEVIAKFAKKG